MIPFTCILLLETCLFNISYNVEPFHNPVLHNNISVPFSKHNCFVSDSPILTNLLFSCVVVFVVISELFILYLYS